MRKTSVYLEDRQAELLRRVAEREGRSQAEVLRDALSDYAERAGAPRNFALARVAGQGPDPRPREQASAAPSHDDLMKGFGWDSLSPDQQRRFSAQDRRRSRAT